MTHYITVNLYTIKNHIKNKTLFQNILKFSISVFDLILIFKTYREDLNVDHKEYIQFPMAVACHFGLVKNTSFSVIISRHQS